MLLFAAAAHTHAHTGARAPEFLEQLVHVQLAQVAAGAGAAVAARRRRALLLRLRLLLLLVCAKRPRVRPAALPIVVRAARGRRPGVLLLGGPAVASTVRLLAAAAPLLPSLLLAAAARLPLARLLLQLAIADAALALLTTLPIALVAAGTRRRALLLPLLLLGLRARLGAALRVAVVPAVGVVERPAVVASGREERAQDECEGQSVYRAAESQQKATQEGASCATTQQALTRWTRPHTHTRHHTAAPVRIALVAPYALRLLAFRCLLFVLVHVARVAVDALALHAFEGGQVVG